jgi:hypothetical protein
VKRLSSLILVVLVAAACASAEPPDTLWTKLYRPFWYGECLDARLCSDGGFILGGVALSDSGIVSQARVARTDSNGDTLWMRTLSSSGNDRAFVVGQASDGGYVAAGTTGLSTTLYTARLNSTGDTIWTRQTASNGSLRQGIITADDGILATGLAAINEGDMFALRADQSGAVLWQRAYGGPHYECAYRPYQTADSGFLVPG